MDPIKKFQQERAERVRQQGENESFIATARDFTAQSMREKYSYNFSWMGRPIIQYPQDMVAMQEIIWEVRPDLIVEMGVAHGGTLIYYASLFAMMNLDGKVLGVDIDIRDHNRFEIEKHPMFDRIEMIQGSSVDQDIADQVHAFAKDYNNILLVLDSNHTHDHVLREMQLYSPLVRKGSYMVVYDTAVEFAPDDLNNDRPWAVGDNPHTAVMEFLKSSDRFEIDPVYNGKLLISMAPDGYLKCVSD